MVVVTSQKTAFTVTKNVTIAIEKVMRFVSVQKGNVVVRGDLVERR